MNKKFICASTEYCSFEHHIPAPYLRKTFDVDVLPESAVISICGLGFYMLYINGHNITKGPLAPYISNPDHICYYDAYEIRKYLKNGKNVIGIILGNGFNDPFGGSVWNMDNAEWISPPRVALELAIKNKDRTVIIEADESFKTHPSPIRFDELRMGEYYDANKEITGWNCIEFDDSLWDNAMIAPVPRGRLKECMAERICVRKQISPVRIIKQNKDFVYDFGENNAGVCTLRICAEKGQRIELWHGEELKDGKFDNSSTIFDRPDTQFYKEYGQKDVYIAKGEGLEEYTPAFTYHGFRYVLVKGIKEKQALPELLTYNIMSSDLKKIGGFECSDETVNTLFKMAERSDLSNFYYFPTDCPHREKNGWTGDASFSAAHMILMYDVGNSWREWLNNIRLTQNEEGMLPGIIPTYDWGYEWGNGPAWDSVIFNLPYQLFKKRGNTEIVKENANTMMRYLNYIMQKRNADGTISVGLGDWVPVGREPDDYEAPLELTDSVMVMDMARKASEMFDAVGYKHQASFAKEIYNDLREIIRNNLIDKQTMSAAGDCQTSQAMALYYGVFDKNEKQQAFERLMEYIAGKNYSFDCGCLGMHVLFHVLSEFGQSELAYKMITKKEYPSYAHLIKQGETTLVESFQPDGKGCGSHNHHFLGDISRWFVKCVAGLNIIDPETVEIKPNFIESLNNVYAYHDLPSGRVAVSWDRKNDEIRLNIDCDKAIRYTVKIPDGYMEDNGVIKKV